MEITRESYETLKNEAIKNPDKKTLAALGKWYEIFGDAFFRGYYYAVTDRLGLYPVYKFLRSDPNHGATAKIIGWEMR